MFDRDKDGGRFYCTQHFGLTGTIKTRVEKKKISLTNKENIPQPFAKINNSDKVLYSINLFHNKQKQTYLPIFKIAQDIVRRSGWSGLA